MSVDSPFALGTASLLEVFGVKSTKVLTFLPLRSPTGFGARAHPMSIECWRCQRKEDGHQSLPLEQMESAAIPNHESLRLGSEPPSLVEPPLFLSTAHRGS